MFARSSGERRDIASPDDDVHDRERERHVHELLPEVNGIEDGLALFNGARGRLHHVGRPVSGTPRQQLPAATHPSVFPVKQQLVVDAVKSWRVAAAQDGRSGLLPEGSP